jgi:hypothetical protein
VTRIDRLDPLCDNLSQGRSIHIELKYQEKSMNRPFLFLLGAIAAAALFTPAGGAKAATYCIVGEIDQCRFSSLEQCLAALNGIGGYCTLDSQDSGTPIRSRNR